MGVEALRPLAHKVDAWTQFPPWRVLLFRLVFFVPQPRRPPPRLGRVANGEDCFLSRSDVDHGDGRARGLPGRS